MTAAELKTKREEIGWTQQKLADLLGVRRVQVTRWETGVAPIDNPTALAIEYVMLRTKKKKKKNSKA